MARRIKNKQRIPLDNARNSLTIVWFVGAALSFILLAAQSILGKFENSLQDVWGWYTPTVFPTSALILGVIGATALQPGYDKLTSPEYGTPATSSRQALRRRMGESRPDHNPPFVSSTFIAAL
jgi:hypothetical protein